MRESNSSGKKPIEEIQAQRARKAKFERVSSVSKSKKPELPLANVGTTEEKARRKTGIDILGEVPWGTHFCVFYQSKQDLIDILVPYFKEGLENNEFCMWITSEPLSAEDAGKSLSQAVTNLDDYIKKGQIEILDYSDWYTKTGAFEADSVLQGWVQKHDEAIKRGFNGLRVTGNTLWLEKKDWIKFTDYEAVVNGVIGKYKMLAICTYCLDKCGASEILDVENNHQFSLIKWRGDWKILESSSKNQLEARLAEQTAIAQALERSKKDWVKTFNAMSDWVALIDVGGRILRSNRAGENFTGKTLDEIIGQSCCKLVHGQDKHILGCPLRTMLHSRQRATMELNVPNTNRWLMVIVDPVKDGKGNIVGAVHITRDISDRKKAEKAVRDSEERYKYLFEQSPLGIGLATPDGRLVHINKAMEVITGYFEAELKKLNLVDLYENLEDRKKLLGTIERYGCAVDFPARLKRKDGTLFDALLNVSRVKLGDQELFQTICMDITERKQAEKALRESEERYRSLIEHIPSVSWKTDQDGNTIFISPNVEGVYGYTPDEIYNKGDELWFARVHPNDREKVKVAFDGLFTKGEKYDVEYRIQRKDGNWIWLHDVAGNISEKDGILYAYGAFSDITERKKVEEQIEKLARFPAENPNPVLRVSGYGTVIYGNKNSSPLLKVWQCRVGGSLPDEWYEVVLDALSSGQSRQTEVKCSGQTFSLTFAPVMNANYVNVYGLDITDRKQAEKKLLEDQEQLRSMASELSLAEERERRRIAEGLHDEISQPLAFLNIKLDLLKKSTNERSFVDSFSEMETTIGKLISSARSFTFDLSSPVVYELGLEAGIEDWLHTNIQAKHGIATTFEDDGQIKPLDDDMRGFLFKAVKELLVNVVKHAKASSVKVSVVRDEDKIKICVEDNGVGFNPAEKKGGLFDPSGYGLFSIHERLDYLRGSVDIESKLGHGTRVTLVAPLKIQGTEVKRGLQ